MAKPLNSDLALRARIITFDSRGVFVVRDNTGFKVIERDGGRSSALFTYRVVAKRKGYENYRLEVRSDLTQDPNL